MNGVTWKEVAIAALVVVMPLVAWVGANHITKPYHPQVVELIDTRMTAERMWNEAKHDQSAADRSETNQRLARIEALLEVMEERTR